MNQTSKYIEEKMKELAMNIADFNIGQTIKDTDESSCKITNKTRNTIEVFIEKKSKNGVDAKQWFDMKMFNRRFKF